MKKTNPCRDLVGAISRLTRLTELWIVQAAFETRRKPYPLLCRCGRRFRDTKTWLPHWNKAHPRLARRYEKAPSHERVNLLLGMMRAASPRKAVI